MVAKHIKNMHTKLTLICVLLCLATSSFGAPTSHLLFSIGASIETTTNIYLAPTDNKVSANIYHALFSVDYKKKTARTDSILNLTIDNRKYQHDLYPNTPIYTGAASLNVILGDSRSVWETNDKAANVLANNGLPDTPNNNQNVNYLTTGPRFVFFKNAKNSLDANFKYQNFYVEKDNTGYYGSIAGITYLRNVTRTFSAGLDLNYNYKNYLDNVDNTNYSLSTVALIFKKRMKLSSAEIDVGESYINAANHLSNNTNLFRAKYNHQLGEKNYLYLGYRRELQDFSGVYATTTQDGVLSNISSDVFLLKEGVASFQKQFGFSTIILTYTYFSNEYSDVNNPGNFITNDASLTYTNNISNSVSLSLRGSYSGTKFTASVMNNRTDTLRRYDITIRKHFLNKYDISLNTRYSVQGSTDGVAIYDELRASITANYYFR